MKRIFLLTIFLIGCDDANKNCTVEPIKEITLNIQKFNSCNEVDAYVGRTVGKLNTLYSSETNLCTYDASFQAIEGDAQPDNANQPTNKQEQNVDEADRVKLSNKYIFYSRNNSIEVLDRKTKKHIKSIASYGYWRPHIYVFNETLAVLRPHKKPFIYDPEKEKQVDNTTFHIVYPQPQKFEMVLFDVHDDIKEISHKEILGNYKDSRLSKKGVLTLITEASLNPNLKTAQSKAYRDQVYKNIDCSQVSNPAVIDDNDLTLTSIHTFHLNSKNTHNETHLLGSYRNIYQNERLFLTKNTNNWQRQSQLQVVSRLDYVDEQWKEKARFTYEGQALGSWSFKESGDYLYIASTTNSFWRGQRETHLNVYKNGTNSTALVNRIKGIAPGETLQSARFTEDYAYLVTFRNVDPLFVIDIKDKSRPKIVSELKIPGFSSYLHPTDNNQLIGVGYSGDMSRLQLSLFDVSDPIRPQTMDQILVGNSSWSSAQHDHHSFFYDNEWRLLSLPIRTSEYSATDEDLSKSGAFIYNIEQNKFVLEAHISHKDWIEEHCGSTRPNEPYLYVPSGNDISRVHRIDGELMSFSDFGLRVHSLENPKQEEQRTLFTSPKNSCPLPIRICSMY